MSVAVSELLILSIKTGLSLVAVGQVARVVQNVLWHRKKPSSQPRAPVSFSVSAQLDPTRNGPQAYQLPPRIGVDVCHIK